MSFSDHINDLVILQEKLLKSFATTIDTTHINSDGSLSIFARKSAINNQLEVDGEGWKMRFHGVGVCFTRVSDGAVVDFDKHLDKPNSITPWKAALYLESIGISQDQNKLRDMLDASNLIKVEYDRYEVK